MAYFQYPYLDDEERETIESLNRGEWSPLSDEDYAREMAVLINAARGYFGLPPEDDPQIPPRRRPLSPAELMAQLPDDADAIDAIQETPPYLGEEEQEDSRRLTGVAKRCRPAPADCPKLSLHSWRQCRRCRRAPPLPSRAMSIFRRNPQIGA